MPYSYELFGKSLLQKRKKQQLSMQELAERAGISKSLISKIEKKQVYPTIKTASQIAEALKFSLAEMFLVESKGKVIYYPAEKQFEINDYGYIRRFMSPSIEKSCVEIFHERLTEGAETGYESHMDADKYIIALDEGLSLTAEGRTYHLEVGDSIHIARQVKHKLTNKLDNEVPFITIIHHKHEIR